MIDLGLFLAFLACLLICGVFSIGWLIVVIVRGELQAYWRKRRGPAK